MTPRITKSSEHLPRHRSNGRANQFAALSRAQGRINRLRLAINKLDEALQDAKLGDKTDGIIVNFYADTHELDNIAARQLREVAEDQS